MVLLNDKTNENKIDIMVVRGKKMKPSSAITVHPIVEREGTRIHFSLEDNTSWEHKTHKVARYDTVKTVKKHGRILEQKKTNKMIYKAGKGISPER